MQDDRIVCAEDLARRAEEAAGSGRVQALGLSDALRVRLRSQQVSGLIDELDEVRRALDETFETVRARWEALSESQRQSGLPAVAELEHEVSATAYRLDIIRALRAQVGPTSTGEDVTVVGPAETLTTVAAGAARNAAESLAELVRAPVGGDATSRDGLRAAAFAALAWIDTYAECQALEFFAFDVAWDPVERL